MGQFLALPLEERMLFLEGFSMLLLSLVSPLGLIMHLFSPFSHQIQSCLSPVCLLFQGFVVIPSLSSQQWLSLGIGGHTMLQFLFIFCPGCSSKLSGFLTVAPYSCSVVWNFGRQTAKCWPVAASRFSLSWATFWKSLDPADRTVASYPGRNERRIAFRQAKPVCVKLLGVWSPRTSTRTLSAQSSSSPCKSSMRSAHIWTTFLVTLGKTLSTSLSCSSWLGNICSSSCSHFSKSSWVHNLSQGYPGRGHGQGFQEKPSMTRGKNRKNCYSSLVKRREG